MAVACLLPTACRESGARETIVWRAVPDDPRRALDVETVTEATEVVAWDLRDPEERRAWGALQGAASESRTECGLSIESPSRDRPVWRPVPTDLPPFDEVEVDVSGLVHPGSLEWLWSPTTPPTEAIAGPRVGAREALDSDGHRFRLDLAREPTWAFQPARSVGFRLANPLSGAVCLNRVTLRRRRVSEARLATYRDPVRVTVGHEVRDGFLIPVGDWRVWRIPTGEAAALEMWLGVVRRGAGRLEVEWWSGEPDQPRERLSATAIEIQPSADESWSRLRVAPERPADRNGRSSFLRARLEATSPQPPPLAALATVRGFASSPNGASEPNLILISIDTLRADRTSLHGNPRRTTPRLETLAAERAVAVRRAVASAPSTLPSHASMLTGLNVLAHGAYLDRPLAAVGTLADRLRTAGYDTLAVTGGGYLHPHFGLDRGFESYRYWPRRGETSGEELADGLSRAVAAVESARRRPFFLFLHSYEVHAPYRARSPFIETWRSVPTDLEIQPWPRGLHRQSGFLFRNKLPRVSSGGIVRDLEPGEEPLLVDLYDSGVARADAAVGEMWSTLARLGLDERTVFVVTSDHGESLGEGGLFDHGYLYESNLHVPLVIAYPGSHGGRWLESSVGLVDLLPTLLDLLGIDEPDPVDGRSFAAQLRTRGLDAAPQRALSSYAPENNEGIALSQDGLKVVVRDAVLVPVESRAERLVWTAESEAPAGAGEDSGRFERLDRLARRILGGQWPGVELRVRNDAHFESRAFASGTMVRSNSVRWLGSEVAGEWVAEGVVAIPLVAGGEISLRLHPRSSSESLELRSGPIPSTGFATTLEEVCRSGGRREAKAGRLSISIEAVALCGSEPGRSSARDEELEDRLRSLGYLQ